VNNLLIKEEVVVAIEYEIKDEEGEDLKKLRYF